MSESAARAAPAAGPRQPARELTAEQHRRKREILTQPSPAKVRESSSAVVLKQGSLFLLATDSGEVPWELPHGFGLFHEDCRYLDGYTLRLNGLEPTVLSSSAAGGSETRHDLTNPELPAHDGGPGVPKETLAIRRRRWIHGGVLRESLLVRNYGARPARIRLELRFRARFEHLFILRGFLSGPRGELVEPHVIGADTLHLCYQGRDGVRRTTAVALHPAPAWPEPARAAYEWTLEAGAWREVELSVTPSAVREAGPLRCAAQPGTFTLEALRQHVRRPDEMWLAGAAEVRASNPLFGQVLRRSLLDLRLLRSRLGRQHYFAAGIPWFATLFGRDAAVVAIQTLPFGPTMARETLRLLARYQARRHDAYRDAEPGKILHELRTGELARLGAIPQSPAYYGTIDATLLFLILLAEYVNWTGDLALARGLLPNVHAALTWMECYADHDGDGYLDYTGAYAGGLINQGWKDSGNAIVDADGSLAEPPIGLCEVQAYAYRAWRQTAGVLEALGEGGRAADLERRAAELRARFDRDYWSDELGCYVLARQAGGRPAAVVSSNAGQVLWGQLAEPERAARVAERLMAPDMFSFSGWGVRTLSRDARAFNPMSYHLGSVWPHDNSLILSGLRAYGQDEPALRIFDVLFEAACGFSGFRLPELYCGFEREDGEPPVRYPVACSPQAWAAGALPYGLHALLGLQADALDKRLVIRRPQLPAWLEWVELRGARVGPARLDLRFERRTDGLADVQADVRAGRLRVEQVEAPAALAAD